MTIPHERYRAMKMGYDFLLSLCDPKKTPKVPKQIRREAASILKHYPYESDFEQIADALPNLFEKENPFSKISTRDDQYIPEGEKSGC